MPTVTFTIRVYALLLFDLTCFASFFYSSSIFSYFLRSNLYIKSSLFNFSCLLSVLFGIKQSWYICLCFFLLLYWVLYIWDWIFHFFFLLLGERFLCVGLYLGINCGIPIFSLDLVSTNHNYHLIGNVYLWFEEIFLDLSL